MTCRMSCVLSGRRQQRLRLGGGGPAPKLPGGVRGAARHRAERLRCAGRPDQRELLAPALVYISNFLLGSQGVTVSADQHLGTARWQTIGMCCSFGHMHSILLL